MHPKSFVSNFWGAVHFYGLPAALLPASVARSAVVVTFWGA